MFRHKRKNFSFLSGPHFALDRRHLQKLRSRVSQVATSSLSIHVTGRKPLDAISQAKTRLLLSYKQTSDHGKFWIFNIPIQNDEQHWEKNGMWQHAFNWQQVISNRPVVKRCLHTHRSKSGWVSTPSTTLRGSLCKLFISGRENSPRIHGYVTDKFGYFENTLVMRLQT